MKDFPRISSAFENFADWSSPWKFMSTVTCVWPVNAGELTAMNQVWAEAMSETHWTSDDLPACASRAKVALAEKYPWLTPGARENLARAASYQWR